MMTADFRALRHSAMVAALPLEPLAAAAKAAAAAAAAAAEAPPQLFSRAIPSNVNTDPTGHPGNGLQLGTSDGSVGAGTGQEQ